MLLLLVSAAYGLVYVLLEAGDEPEIERLDVTRRSQPGGERPRADSRPQPVVGRTAHAATTAAALRSVDLPRAETLSEAPRGPRPEAAPDFAAIAEAAERGEMADAGLGGARMRHHA